MLHQYKVTLLPILQHGKYGQWPKSVYFFFISIVSTPDIIINLTPYLRTSPPKTHCWFFSLLSPVPNGETFHWVTWKDAFTMAWLFSLVACWHNILLSIVKIIWEMILPSIFQLLQTQKWHHHQLWLFHLLISVSMQDGQSTSKPHLDRKEKCEKKQ